MYFSFLIKTKKNITLTAQNGIHSYSILHPDQSIYRKVQNFSVKVPCHATSDSCHISVECNGKDLYHNTFMRQSYSVEDTIRLLMGSCAFIGTGIYRAIKLHNPLDIFTAMNNDPNDGMVWLGDNVYYLLETRKEKLMVRRMVKIRKKKEKLQQFLSSTPQYAIWDDHDYGPNNCDGSFKNKVTSERVFKTLWPNPYDSTLSEGNYCKVSKGDIDLFLMDDRFFSEKWKKLLGISQLQWLIDGLRHSTATFKIICIGNQVINPFTSGESYVKFEEYQDLLAAIKKNKIGGVLFISGDRHHANLQVVKQDDMYPLYNFTTSPLTSWLNPQNTSIWENTNPKVIAGTQVNDYNYGKVTVSGLKGSRVITIECKSASGEVFWNYTIEEQELKFNP